MVRDYNALVAYLHARMRAPFAWGRDANDCISFAAGAARAQTGRDPLQGLSNWTTQRGALRVLAQYGGLEAAVSSRLPLVTPAQALRGDLALVEAATGPALMVIEGATLIGPGELGAIRRPRGDMLRAWSIA